MMRGNPRALALLMSHVIERHEYQRVVGLDLNQLRIVHDRLHDWPRGESDKHPHPVCKVDSCTGVLFQLKPGGFFVCDVGSNHFRHMKLCADDEGRMVCVCGLDQFITRNPQPKEKP